MTYSKLFSIIGISLVLLAFKGDKLAYQIFNKKGKITSYEKMLKASEKADIIFFGEIHNDPIDHWLQYELTKDIFEKINENLVLGAEMFEADDQIIVNEYLSGDYPYKTLNSEAKLWPNFRTDYKPLLDFALKNQLNFVATNIPRRYANLVYKNGFKGLNNINNVAKKWMTPLPIAYPDSLKGYQEMLKMAGGHGGENLPKAQAIKDATMAYFILKNWKKGQTFIHYNGTYHSNNFEGIIWYLKQQKPNLNILTIGAIEQASIDTLAQESIGSANFVVCTPETMTKTQ